jgi:hypothetical protein
MTIKVIAKSRTRDISSSNAKPAKGENMVSWAESFNRSGVRFSTDYPTEVSIVRGKPYGRDNEVNEAGAKAIILEPRLKVWDNEYVRKVIADALEKHREKPQMYGPLPRQFVHAEIVNEMGAPVVDNEIAGQEVVFDDGYEEMTKPKLKELLQEKGIEGISELWQAGKDAMIAALRGH